MRGRAIRLKCAARNGCTVAVPPNLSPNGRRANAYRCGIASSLPWKLPIKDTRS